MTNRHDPDEPAADLDDFDTEDLAAELVKRVAEAERVAEAKADEARREYRARQDLHYKAMGDESRASADLIAAWRWATAWAASAVLGWAMFLAAAWAIWRNP